jgi:hypothetical protein
MAYGYMRAFETYRWFTEGLSNTDLFHMVDSTDAIIQARKRIWTLETEAVQDLPPPLGLPADLPGIAYPYLVFDPTKMAEIRRLKQQVLNSVRIRFETWSPESLPKAFSDSNTGYTNTIFDWWETWERHSEPLESWLRSRDLWTPLTTSLTPPVAGIETNVPPRPGTPAAMRAALTV